ncbi:hypothetical protein SAMN05216582_11750 [Selenomonas ruminantium]|uniref:Uncharacterized protein n=1 Tax=Selenomonas ruminantium TaxID=971 RepID=A0A1M6V9T9_SELRU|nr:hypothetical protein SAMN05216582_11750 [Selenomonas ruminantium]
MLFKVYYLQIFLTNEIISINISIRFKYFWEQVSYGLNRESGISRSGPATVRWSPAQYVTGVDKRTLGRRCRMMKPSQENCLFWHHRDSLSESCLRAMGRGLNLVWGIQACGFCRVVLLARLLDGNLFAFAKRLPFFVHIPKKEEAVL